MSLMSKFDDCCLTMLEMPVPDRFLRMVDIVPEGTSGKWCVKHFMINGAIASMLALRALINNRPLEYTPEGKYAKLAYGKQLVMSDAQMERITNYDIIKNAKGRVLIAGLGLGMVVTALLDKPEVNSIVIVEKSTDVIALVAGAMFKYAGNRKEDLHIVNECIHLYTPKHSFDTIYFDIWPDISRTNLPEMLELTHAFGPYLNAGGWMNHWSRDIINKQLLDERDK